MKIKTVYFQSSVPGLNNSATAGASVKSIDFYPEEECVNIVKNDDTEVIVPRDNVNSMLPAKEG